jgi:hypothetical protein
MRQLNREKLISLLSVSESEQDKMAHLFEAVAPVHSRGEASLSRLTSSGVYKAEQIQLNGVPAFLFWWSKTSDAGLWIHAAQAYDSNHDIGVAFLGAAAIQKREACTYIRFMTLRAGLVRSAEKHGYKIDGLIMSK